MTSLQPQFEDFGVLQHLRAQSSTNALLEKYARHPSKELRSTIARQAGPFRTPESEYLEHFQQYVDGVSNDDMESFERDQFYVLNHADQGAVLLPLIVRECGERQYGRGDAATSECDRTAQDAIDILEEIASRQTNLLAIENLKKLRLDPKYSNLAKLAVRNYEVGNRDTASAEYRQDHSSLALKWLASGSISRGMSNDDILQLLGSPIKSQGDSLFCRA